MKQVICPNPEPSPFGDLLPTQYLLPSLFVLVHNSSQWQHSFLPSSDSTVDETLQEAVFLPHCSSVTPYYLHSSVFILAGFSYVDQDRTTQSAHNSLSKTLTTHGSTPTSGLNSKAAVCECRCPLTSTGSPFLFMTVP